MIESQRVGVTRKNIRCCRPFPDSLLKQPNLMNSCKRESNKSLSSPEMCYRVNVLDVRHRIKLSTHPTRDNKIVNADQILLQLQKLLKVLHFD